MGRSAGLGKRQLLQGHNEGGHSNAMRQALGFQSWLDAKPDRTRAEAAVMFGVSRARVTRHLNLLKLPSVIVDALAECQDAGIVGYFTEGRLRPLTVMADPASVLAQFSAMLAEARCAAAGQERR